jgi:hypothetical protein
MIVTRLRGRAIAQAVNRRLPTAAVQVRAQVKSCGICGGQSGAGAGFLRVLRFPLPILIPPTASQTSSSIIRDWYTRPNSGRRAKWTHPNPRKKKLLVSDLFVPSLYRKVYRLFRESPPLDSVLSHMNPVHTFTLYFLNIHSNTLLSIFLCLPNVLTSFCFHIRIV